MEEHVEGKKNIYKSAFGDPYRVWVRRMQCTFGWDWVHRFVTVGIWRPCRLISFEGGRINNVFAYTNKIENSTAHLNIEVDASSATNYRHTIHTEIFDPSGNIVWSEKKKIDGDSIVKMSAEVANAQLWWPNGAGKQPLYTIKTRLTNEQNKEVHSTSTKTGIRTVVIEEMSDQDQHGGSSMTFVINGKRIFAKGGNWIPADPFPSRITPERYKMLISQAKDAGMNMMRAWGGGIYEPEAFWNVCDSLGIMIWQDFMMACGTYPAEDPKFVDLFAKEVKDNVVKLRNHPSLVVWCGDNELGLGKSYLQSWPFKEVHTDITAPLIAKLDPSRPFRITSPMGNDPKNGNSPISGDAHLGAQYSDELFDSPNALQYRTLIERYASSRFLSESTTAGSPPKRSLLRFMTKEDLNKSEMFDYHTKDNPYMKGGHTLFGKLESLTEKLYGNPGNDVDRRIRQLEYIQYEFVRLSMETSRSNKFYSSGILFWMFNDCWPASGWSHIDYWGTRKAAWYAMASACKPIIVATRQDKESLKWWITSDEMKVKQVKFTLKKQPLDGRKATIIKEKQFTVPENGRILAHEEVCDQLKAKLSSNSILVAEISYGNTFDRSFWSPSIPKDISYPQTTLDIKKTNDKITIKTNNWAHVVSLSGDADFEDNYFEMLPGESRTIRWKARENMTNADNIEVRAWND